MGVLLLVRHGQASFGADDYDVLSEVGWEQVVWGGINYTPTEDYCLLTGSSSIYQSLRAEHAAAEDAAPARRPRSWCA